MNMISTFFQSTNQSYRHILFKNSRYICIRFLQIDILTRSVETLIVVLLYYLGKYILFMHVYGIMSMNILKLALVKMYEGNVLRYKKVTSWKTLQGIHIGVCMYSIFVCISAY